MKKSSQAALESVLSRARTLGFLGPGPIRVHVDHARRFLAQLETADRRLVDLGSGGGLPGIPLAVFRPELEIVLLDASEKRCAFLRESVEALELGDRVRVLSGRAEELGHEPAVRGWADVVVSRSFAAPHHTIECAMALVRVGGRIVVSEPPGGRRWPGQQLEDIGLTQLPSDPQVACFQLLAPVGDSIPRRFKKQDRSPIITLD